MDFETKVLLLGCAAMLVIVIVHFFEKWRMRTVLKWQVIDGPAPLEADAQGFRYVLMWMNHIIQDPQSRGAEVSMVYEWRGFVEACMVKIYGTQVCCGDFDNCNQRCTPLIENLRRQLEEQKTGGNIDPSKCVIDGVACGVGGYCQHCQHI